jgi:hypothetical protein
MKIELESLIEKHCLVYVNDVLVFSNTFKHMEESLDQVLGRISSEGRSIDIKKYKCFWRMESISYDKDLVKMASDLSKAIYRPK